MEEPKRKYTVTPKVLAASRANLVKANGVSKDFRYRPTPRRLLACHANLQQALAVVNAAGDDSRACQISCRHGLYATYVSLRSR